MIRRLGQVLILVLAILPALAADGGSYGVDTPPIERVVLISFDGARKFWVDQLTQDGTLPNLAYLKSRGGEVELKIVSHITVTDPGLANIETGYGAEVTGIDRNYFGSSFKRVIPDGLTTFERLKAAHGQSWKNALAMPWTQGPIDNPNITRNQDSIFWNAKDAIDYWFSSENVTWTHSDPDSQLSLGSALLRADFLASKLGEFIVANARNSFYARIHVVEPDFIGHAFGESEDNKIGSEYLNALKISDRAVGIIIDAVREAGIEDSTVILVTTDHGFIGPGHSGPPYPEGDPEASTVFLIGNTELILNELGWGIMDDIAPTVLAMTGIDITELTPKYSETSHAKPLWQIAGTDRETSPPEIVSVTATRSMSVGELFEVTVVARDASGIRNVKLWYAFGPIDFRQTGLARVDEQTFKGTLGPFAQPIELKWYIEVIDAAIAPNIAYYPEQGKFTATMVVGGTSEPPATQPLTSFSNMTLVIIVAAVAVVVVAFSLRRKILGKYSPPKQ